MPDTNIPPPITWQGAMPGMNVPASPTASQGSGIEDIIKNISTPISPDLIRAAISPIPGAHTAQVPSSLTRQIQPYQDTPLDNRPVVGAGNARGQGITNSIVAVTNALGHIVNTEAQAKQGQIRDAAQKVITAQQNIDESQQAHDAAIASGDATTASKMMETIKQNQQARDQVFADPKMRKALVKGFNISYTDPQSNKTEEHQAVMEAIKSAKTAQEKKQAIAALKQKQNATAGSAAGAAYAKAQPQGLAPNTAAIQQLQIAQASQKIQEQTLKDYMTFQGVLARSGATVQAAQIREIGAGIRQQAIFDHTQDMQDQRFKQAEALYKDKLDNSYKEMFTRASLARELSRSVFTDKQTDPTAMYAKARSAVDKYQSNREADGKNLVQYQDAKLALYQKYNNNPPADSVQMLNTEILHTQQQIKIDEANVQNWTRSAANLRSAFKLDDIVTGGGEQDGSTGNSSNIQPDSTGSGTDWTDPLLYNNQDDQ